MDRETLVSFGSDAEAEVARSMLEGAGISAWIERDEPGRVVLRVASKDLSRARAFFLREDEDEPADAATDLRHHPDSLAVSVRETNARRAWFGAWSGILAWGLVTPLPWHAALLVPVALDLWSLWLLADVFFSRGPLGRRWRRLAPVTLALDLACLVAIGLMLRAAGG